MFSVSAQCLCSAPRNGEGSTVSWAPLRGRVVALAEPMLSRSLEDNGSPLPHAMPHTG